MPDYQFFVLLCKYVLENLEESSQSQGFREGRLGYSKHNFFFFAFLLGLSLVSHRSNYFWESQFADGLMVSLGDLLLLSQKKSLIILKDNKIHPEKLSSYLEPR